MRSHHNRIPVQDRNGYDSWYYEVGDEDGEFIPWEPGAEMAYDRRRPSTPKAVLMKGGGNNPKNFKRHSAEGRNRSRSKHGRASPMQSIVRNSSDKTGSRSAGSMDRREANSFGTDKSGKSSGRSSGRASHNSGSRHSGSRHSDPRYGPIREMSPVPMQRTRSRGHTSRASYGSPVNSGEMGEVRIPPEHNDMRGRRLRAHRGSHEEDGTNRHRSQMRERPLSRERSNSRGRYQNNRTDQELRQRPRSRSPRPIYVNEDQINDVKRAKSPIISPTRGGMYERASHSRSPLLRERPEIPHRYAARPNSGQVAPPPPQWKHDDWNMTAIMRGISERRDESEISGGIGRSRVIEIVRDDDISRSVLTGDDTLEYYVSPKNIDRFRGSRARRTGSGFLSPSWWQCSGLCGASTNTKNIAD